MQPQERSSIDPTNGAAFLPVTGRAGILQIRESPRVSRVAAGPPAMREGLEVI